MLKSLSRFLFPCMLFPPCACRFSFLIVSSHALIVSTCVSTCVSFPCVFILCLSVFFPAGSSSQSPFAVPAGAISPSFAPGSHCPTSGCSVAGFPVPCVPSPSCPALVPRVPSPFLPVPVFLRKKKKKKKVYFQDRNQNDPTPDKQKDTD